MPSRLVCAGCGWVPFLMSKIEERLERVAPTITEIATKGGKVILLAHFGRPKEGEFSESESLAPVARHLSGLLGAEGYRALAAAAPGRFRVLPATAPIEAPATGCDSLRASS